MELYSTDDRDYLLARSDLSEIDEDLLKFCQDTLAERLEPIIEQLDPLPRCAVHE